MNSVFYGFRKMKKSLKIFFELMQCIDRMKQLQLILNAQNMVTPFFVCQHLVKKS